MVLFGVAVSDRAIFEQVALPGIRRAAEADSRLITREGYDSIQLPYNELLDEVAELDELEALVLLHQDVELTDASLVPRLRSLLRDPRVGLVGAIGWAPPSRRPDSRRARDGRPDVVPGLRSSALEGSAAGRPEDRYGRMDTHYSVGSHEVEIADGLLLAIAPWVVRSLRFDERLAEGFHGYDVDYSFRVRAAGGRVVCNDIPHVHHMSRLWRDREEYARALVTTAERWDPSVRPAEWAPAFVV